jgi:predicted nucleotidyltransferase
MPSLPRSQSRQYGPRESAAVRRALLEAALAFVREVRTQAGVRRVALVGSLATDTAFPKDVDLLVTIADAADLRPLARAGRRLAGRAQAINGGADVFLASPAGDYLGRTCPWRTCGPGQRLRCGARYATGRPFLRDDLDTLVLTGSLIAAPPAVLWPVAGAAVSLPPDVDALLLTPLRADAAGA